MFEKISKLRKKIKHIYYYVPPCPYCNSPVTGRIIKDGAENDIDWQVYTSLKHGELVKVAKTDPEATCFCLNCEREWRGDVETKFLTSDEIEEEKKKRQTFVMLTEYNKQKRSEQKEYNKKHPLISPFKNFIGRL